MKFLLVLIATFVALCYLVAWLLHIEHWAHGTREQADRIRGETP